MFFSFIILGSLKTKNYCQLYVITSRPIFSSKGTIYTNNKELLLNCSNVMDEIISEITNVKVDIDIKRDYVDIESLREQMKACL